MQWLSSRIWTRFAVFISYDDNNYTTGTSWHLVAFMWGIDYVQHWKKRMFLCVLWHFNLCWLFKTKSIFIKINRSIWNNSSKYKYTAYFSKTFLFQAIQFSQTDLIQTINFSISVIFVYTQLNVKTAFHSQKQLFFEQFSLAYKNSSISNNKV